MADLTTADVYEDASLIGQDIEKLIQRFGHDAVLDLMPKVICVLEKLEVVVGEREKDKLEIAELKLENERLYWEITKEATQRRKLDEVGNLPSRTVIMNRRKSSQWLVCCGVSTN